METRLALALLWIAPTVAAAQRVSGTVRATPDVVSGAVVTMLDSTGQTVARTLSDGNGRYSLPLAANAARLRAVRIGFRPLVVDLKRTEANVTLDLLMDRTPVILETVRIRAEANCGNSPDAVLVHDVWEQARLALLAAIVAREASPARVRLLEYQRRLSVSPRVMLEQRIVTNAGVSTRPVAAARTGPQLADSGYLGHDRGDNVYYAPDADVLFDDTFTETHCFGLVRGSRDRAGQLGLTFRPRDSKRDFVDVEGTLWLNSQATELLQLDYRYSNVDPEASRLGTGGTLHFRTMANGVVIIDSWSILAPVMVEIRRTGGIGTSIRSTVSNLIETGGVLLDATWPDGTRWSDSLGRVRGRVREEKSGAPVGGIRITTLGASGEANASGEYVLGPLPPGRYVLAVDDTAYGNYVKRRQVNREVNVGRSEAVTVDFEVPSRDGILDDMCRGDRASDGTTILLGAIEIGRGALPDRLEVRASWYTSPAGAEQLDLSRINQATRAAGVNAAGYFYVCGVPRRSSWISLRLVSGKTPIVDTLIAPGLVDAPDAAGTRQVEWTVPAGILAAALQGDAAVLSGRVTRNGNPVTGAEVWIVFKDTIVKTDSTGRFRVGGLGAGPQIVQIRRIGHAVKRDSVILKAREETIKNFAMEGAQELDTMRTVGRGRAYDTPRLQDFERRRLSGMGHFISEDELRKHDSRSIADILRTYTPGVRFEAYRGGLFLSSFSAPTMKRQPLGPQGPVGCWVSVYLDGIVVYGGESSATPPDMKQFLAMTLSGVEYYGAAELPLQYKSTTNNCGTLLLWTRGKQ